MGDFEERVRKLARQFTAVEAGPLCAAVERGDLDEATRLIEAGASVDAADSTGSTPLIAAVFHRNVPAVRELLRRGADPNLPRVSTSGLGSIWTPLHIAAEGNMHEIAQILLDHGADVNASDEQGETPLSLGVDEIRSPDTVRLLVQRGAKVGASLELARAYRKEPRGEEIVALLEAARANET